MTLTRLRNYFFPAVGLRHCLITTQLASLLLSSAWSLTSDPLKLRSSPTGLQCTGDICTTKKIYSYVTSQMKFITSAESSSLYSVRFGFIRLFSFISSELLASTQTFYQACRRKEKLNTVMNNVKNVSNSRNSSMCRWIRMSELNSIVIAVLMIIIQAAILIEMKKEWHCRTHAHTDCPLQSS